jgi:hypothetical protein
MNQALYAHMNNKRKRKKNKMEYLHVDLGKEDLHPIGEDHLTQWRI